MSPAVSHGRHWVRVLRRDFSTPKDLWLIWRMAWWAVALRVLKRLLSIKTLARLVRRDAPEGPRAPEWERKIVRVAFRLTGPVGPDGKGCLERGLLLYRFLGASGARPRLVVGLSREDHRLAGHAWVTVGGLPVGESVESLAAFIPVVSFPDASSAPEASSAPVAPSALEASSGSVLRPDRSPEEALLVACIAVGPATQWEARVRALLRQDIDWGVFARLARAHGLAPLLFWQLRRLGSGAAPADTLEELQALFERNTWRSVALTGELLRIVDVLAEGGVEAVPYKGPALAAAVYENVALRPFADLDFMVRRAQALRAKELLLSAGYVDQVPHTEQQQRAHLRDRHEYSLMRVDEAVSADVHWALAERHFSFRLDPASLWSRLSEVPLGGRAVRTFCPEDLLLILCAHGTKHLWTRLIWISDIARLVDSHPTLDWTAVRTRARSIGSERMLALGLVLAGELGARLPPEVERWLEQDQGARGLARQVWNRVFREGGREAPFLESARFHLRSRERWRDRARYCLLLLSVPNEGDSAPLPSWAAATPLRYLFRPIRLAAKYGAGSLRSNDRGSKEADRD